MGSGIKSQAMYERAEQVLPGGVSSPVRAFRAVGGTPVVMRRGHGAIIEDVDGNSFVDFVCSWGPLILGHAHPDVVEAVTRASADGTSFGAPCPNEIQLAELVVDSYPGVEQVRFVSSGTEAAMSAIRLARGATGRDAIVKFSGCYHGHADHLLVSAGSGLATFGEPSSAGVPKAIAGLTFVLPLDDEQALRRLFAERGQEIAAVMIEPLPANNGLLEQRLKYLQTLREVTREAGAMLIFDEVISGFRVAPGGYAQASGIQPDMAAFGKVIGGGLPVGAFGGPRELMKHLAPTGPVYQAGTLSGNPVAMAGGYATLSHLEEHDGWNRLEVLGQKLEAQLSDVLSRAPFPARVVRNSSLFWMSLQDGDPPRSAEAIGSGAADLYRDIFHGLLDRGVYIAPSAYEVGFLSLAHDETHIARLCEGLEDVFRHWKSGEATA